MTIHAVPAGKTSSSIIACNQKNKIGRPSDPEDLKAMQHKQTIVLKEGDHLDITVPIYNKAGRPIAASGITLHIRKGESEDSVKEKAQLIAEYLNRAILAAPKPLW